MFDGLLGRKFSGKCKHAVKCINSRLVPIRNKKQATVKFLKKDVADLLANGLDANAFGRMDALMVEINHSSCYDLIEQFCQCIMTHLSAMQKQRECPQEAMEAVSTIIFAAARFSDLPELCDLRQAFTERYGTHMESSVNKEFVEKLQKKSFPAEKKLQLMHDIAQEFSVQWDAKPFERSFSNLSAPKSSQPKKGMPQCTGEPSPMQRTGSKVETPSRGKHEPTPVTVVQNQVVQMGLKDIHVLSDIDDGRLHNLAEKTNKIVVNEPENIEPHSASTAVPPYVRHRSSQNGTHKDNELKDCNELVNNRVTRAEEVMDPTGLERRPARSLSNGRASNLLPPPYVKQKVNDLSPADQTGQKSAFDDYRRNGNKNENHVEEKNSNGSAYDRLPMAEERLDLTDSERRPVRAVNNGRAANLVPPYVKPKVSNLSFRTDPSVQNSALAGFDRSNSDDKESLKDGVLGVEKPPPFSVRRNFTKLPVSDATDGSVDDEEPGRPVPSDRRRRVDPRSNATHYDGFVEEKILGRHSRQAIDDEMDNAIDFGKLLHRTPSGRRRNGSRRSAVAYTGDGDVDEETRDMDRLLIHYCKKRVDNEPGKPRRGNGGQAMEQQGNSKTRAHPRESHPPGRATSLPPEPISSPKEVVKGPSRATSLQLDMLGPKGGCVHPNLPDYDELAARIKALRKA